jgi:hypothetical protein
MFVIVLFCLYPLLILTYIHYMYTGFVYINNDGINYVRNSFVYIHYLY